MIDAKDPFPALSQQCSFSDGYLGFEQAKAMDWTGLDGKDWHSTLFNRVIRFGGAICHMSWRMDGREQARTDCEGWKYLWISDFNQGITRMKRTSTNFLFPWCGIEKVFLLSLL